MVNPEFATVHEDIEEFCRKWPDAEFGPAHCELADFNLSDADIDGTLDMIAQIIDRSYVGDEAMRAILLHLNFYDDATNGWGDPRHSKLEFLETYGFLVMLKTKYAEEVRLSYDGQGIF